MAKRRSSKRRSPKRRSAVTCARLIPHLIKIVAKETKKRGGKFDKAHAESELHTECARATQPLRTCLMRAKGVKSAETCIRKFETVQPLSRRHRKRR